jgi:hypothetical protein
MTETLTKPEAKEARQIASFAAAGHTDYAARCADVWLRSAPNGKAQVRRADFLRSIGLSDTVAYI